MTSRNESYTNVSNQLKQLKDKQTLMGQQNLTTQNVKEVNQIQKELNQNVKELNQTQKELNQKHKETTKNISTKSISTKLSSTKLIPTNHLLREQMRAATLFNDTVVIRGITFTGTVFQKNQAHLKRNDETILVKFLFNLFTHLNISIKHIENVCVAQGNILIIKFVSSRIVTQLNLLTSANTFVFLNNIIRSAISVRSTSPTHKSDVFYLNSKLFLLLNSQRASYRSLSESYQQDKTTNQENNENKDVEHWEDWLTFEELQNTDSQPITETVQKTETVNPPLTNQEQMKKKLKIGQVNQNQHNQQNKPIVHIGKQNQVNPLISKQREQHMQTNQVKFNKPPASIQFARTETMNTCAFQNDEKEYLFQILEGLLFQLHSTKLTAEDICRLQLLITVPR